MKGRVKGGWILLGKSSMEIVFIGWKAEKSHSAVVQTVVER